ncbi:MAG: serine/threonine-protein kinase [Myxococcota bacterium]|nr:serine/threonine-protein kinase [Myxococcota bacterium]
MPATILSNRYELVESLGQGGMATVHRAFDREEGRWVAIKLLAPAMARHLVIRQRFSREAELVIGLSHPNIVPVFAMEQDRSMAWLVMELVEGQTLGRWSTLFGAMPPRMAVETILQVCAGVEFAHASGIIHRDIKPGNVLVDPTGRCQVADFGLARGPDSIRLTRTGVTMGTFGFMAPEQQDDAVRAGVPADIFSLGATLLSLLIGRAPTDIRSGLDAASPSLPLSLSRTLVRATLPRPEHRHESVKRLVRGLNSSLIDLDTPPPGTPPLHIPLQSSNPPEPVGPTLVLPES